MKNISRFQSALLSAGLVAVGGIGGGSAASAPLVFVEAEQFAELGGWDLDQQAMDVMGSPYLLAHGLGVPVSDAVTNKPFPGRKNLKAQWSGAALSNLGGWFWETGFDMDMIHDIERVRDQNLRAMFGAWDALKNVDAMYPNHRLGWVAFVAGKRESRRLLGDVVLTGDDFRKGVKYEDGCFPCSWHIDLHTPHPEFSEGLDGHEFISKATDGPGYKYKGPYWAPYRTLYSRNVPNLFMAGRNISVDREGLGPVRVMRTTGMMGEIVGKAAWIAVRHGTTPRGVYEQRLPLLKELMQQPGSARRDEINGTLKTAPGTDSADLKPTANP